MAQKEETKEVVKIESYLPAIPSAKELQEVLGRNLEGIKAAFQTVTIPTGGGTSWQVPGDGEEAETVKEIVGVIIDHYPTRRYYREEFGGGGHPPDCYSMNGITGIGDPGGECLHCPLNEWKTGKDGRGKACKEVHRIFILTKESLLPYLVALPPTSGSARYEGSFSTYMVRLASKLKAYDAVLTKLKLIQDTNPDKIKYSKACFYRVDDLSPETIESVRSLAGALKSAMREKPIDEGEVAHENGGAGKDPWDKGGNEDVPF